MRPLEARTILFLGDLLAGAIALLPALYIWGRGDAWLQAFNLDFLQQRVPFWFYLLPLAWLVMLVELYDANRASDWRKTLAGIAFAALTSGLLYAVIYLLSPKGSLPRTGVGIFLIVAAILSLVWRLVYIRIFTAPNFMRRVMIVGAGATGATLVLEYERLRSPPFKLIGFIDDDPVKFGSRVAEYPVLGSSESLLSQVESENISDIVVAISGEMRGETFQSLLDAQERGVEITPMPSMYEELLGRVPIHHLESDWVIRSFVVEARVSRFYEMGKRLLDIIGGIIGLLILVLLFPFISLIVLIDSGTPILYSQTRAGKGARTYKLLKFRSMRKDAEADGEARVTERKDARITRAGTLLRRTHMDELPQFWNVVRGEMSLVGPRAERPELIGKYEKKVPFYRARLLVKPGITGWAQIHQDYASNIEETNVKLEYDLYYIKHRNLLMDLVIILRTIGRVIGFRGR
jgi:exopolysaccharide biosynthesis polyprenyl glycosylphosphotransferase